MFNFPETCDIRNANPWRKVIISYEHPTRVEVALQCVAVSDPGGAIDADAARALAPRARVPVLHEHVPLVHQDDVS